MKNFRNELDEYRASFKRIKSANEDVVCSCAITSERLIKARANQLTDYSKQSKREQNC